MRKLRVLLVVGLLAGACGSDDGHPAAAARAGAGAGTGSDGSDEGVTIEHAHGTTTVEGRPERIVTVGVQWTDAVLAFGVQPVAYGHDTLAGPDGRYPWHSDLLEGSTAIDGTDGLPFEQIAALDPDLILVAPYLLAHAADYDNLTEMAPTIAAVSDREVDRWQDQVAVIGDLLGEAEQAASIIDGVDAGVAAVAAELPGLRGRTFALANYVPGDAFYVVADPDDGASVLFEQLGLQLAPEVLAVADGATGRAQFSLERVDLLASDLLIVFANDGDVDDLPGFRQLPAVVSGAYAELGYADVVGINTPTPLSIPYAVELVRPAVDAAAAAA